MKQQKNNERKSKFDVSLHPEIEGMLKELPSIKHRPLIGIHDLNEVLKVVKRLPKLQFPINSMGELIEKLGGSGSTLKIEGIDVDPVRMIKYMPAYYFPIGDMENFVEKMGELIRQNRGDLNISKDMDVVKKEIKGVLSYPLKNNKDLLEQLRASKKAFTFHGRKLILDKVVERIPKSNFPIKNDKEFLSKMKELLGNRALIVPHSVK